MQYFTTDFVDFFKELSQNNHKEWFHSQKKRYEGSVKNPFLHFLDDFIKEIQKHDKTLEITPKDCVLRINRDIRFAKDKSPYNLHYTAFVSNGGKKDKSIPGIFLRFSPESVGIMGGCFGPDKNQLAAIRATIADDITEFRKIISDKNFVANFGEIKGDLNKRIPKDLKAIVEKEPLILHKQFYFVAKRAPELISSATLLAELMEYWKAGRGVNEYFYNCIK